MRALRPQTIGIALSATWAAVAYTAVISQDYAIARQQVEVTRSLCAGIEMQARSGLACKDQQQGTWDRWTRLTTLKGLGVAILPIPFGWVIAEMIGYWIEDRRRRASLRSSFGED
jgi:hypothetical protein